MAVLFFSFLGVRDCHSIPQIYLEFLVILLSHPPRLFSTFMPLIDGLHKTLGQLILTVSLLGVSTTRETKA